ncbi:MAG: RNA-binding S4 domain-containing protein [Clostridia bacterium]|nr:RNA-binding S4 domain-containing protein [Clostridia bacterium]
MRLDKYLKVSRIIKRRTIANEACDAAIVTANGKTVKASYQVKVGDVITIAFGTHPVTFRVLSVEEKTRKENAPEMYEIINS